VRPNRLSSLRQRLHRGTDAFEFQALLEGVSTLDAPAPEAPEPARTAPVPPPDSRDMPASDASAAASAIEDAAAPEVGSSPASDGNAAGSERLRTAIDAVAGRMLEDAGRLRAALAARDATLAGLYLARVNASLELLESIDPGAALATELGAACAPPPGRAWPSPAWSLVELAESPLSGLLPAGLGDGFVREMLLAAWGAALPASTSSHL